VPEQANKVVLCIGSDAIHLNLRCALLNEHGWKVASAGTGHEGVTRFVQERVDAVILDFDDDGTESALIAGELKRRRPQVPLIMLVTEGKVLLEGATRQADALVAKRDEAQKLVDALKSVIDDASGSATAPEA
jgi:CheY-like chemotaxis protein